MLGLGRVAMVGAVLTAVAAMVLNCGGTKVVKTSNTTAHNSENGSPVFKRASDFYAEGQIDSVIVVVREHLRKNGRDPESYTLVPLVTEAFIRKGDYAEAHRLIDMYRQKFPESSFLPRLTYLKDSIDIAKTNVKTSTVPPLQPTDNTKPVATPPPPKVAYTEPVVPPSPSALVKYVAVVEIELDKESGASANMNKAEVRHMTAELRNVAVNNLPSSKYKIMTAESVYAQGGAVLEECADENCVITLGRKIGADYIVRGIISKLGTNLTMAVEMYDTENENLVASSVARSGNTTELLDKAVAACVDMYKKFENERNSRRGER